MLMLPFLTMHPTHEQDTANGTEHKFRTQTHTRYLFSEIKKMNITINPEVIHKKWMVVF